MINLATTFCSPFCIGIVSGKDPKSSGLNDFPFLTKKQRGSVITLPINIQIRQQGGQFDWLHDTNIFKNTLLK
ncbi:hypothetical protein S886_09660 [Salmonella enterica subsp. arizonae]|nr:hypothetical protein [Salmonella enterica subsp. arizonae]